MMEKENNQPVIRARGLSKSFNKVNVLKELSVDFNEGDRIALIGQNGAGKTTLIRCILGQYVFDGSLEVLNKSPRQHRVEILKEVGFVPQIPPPLKITVKELLRFFSDLSHTSQDEYVDIAEKLGLKIADSYNKPFVALSGGMKQKLLVSFALGKKPAILLMDEPSANLDPAAREIFFDYLSRYNKEALLVLSSHRMSEISGLVNRVVEMDFGKIVLDKILEPLKN
ncbi:ABC transporter ATP-binding protein [Candidatus Sulfidibacterium hydrothermale]|uniref:ABC transporter ATP-binding protein n=1 Tax=Candidatus Sulfidibacterium hydrothermale TaxID=2875962 RepID=UPI001F0A3E91|nr:ABC transporter ATP-binding protein [Candidatus Sulfidibacterium hydrothermale]UBM61758.1 ABC transporter ATP-binding protein [Candidatus Sulfidibacterium hydrothermale]